MARKGIATKISPKSRQPSAPAKRAARLKTSVPPPVEDGNNQTKKPVTFLDLPGELRNQVYGYLLPDREPYPDGALRSDGQKCSTSFMASAKQIHKEAASLLYGNETFEVSVRSEGDISFLNRRIPFTDLATANFSTLNQMKGLSLTVSADDSINVCNVQDALCALFEQLRPDHKLHSLGVNIQVSGREDAYLSIFTSSYAERVSRVSVMREFRDIKPGDISRAHITAFLTDPIRTVRSLRKDGKKQAKFKLEFVGKTGKPWGNIPGAVRQLVQGDHPVEDYKAFCGYYKVLRRVFTAIDRLVGLRNRWSAISVSQRTLAAARIRGRVRGLKRDHQTLVVRIHNMINQCALKSDQHTENAREVLFLIDELEAVIPDDDLDTSHYGYRIANAELREWQTTGKYEEKAAKAKRKRDRDEAASRKKTKL